MEGGEVQNFNNLSPKKMTAIEKMRCSKINMFWGSYVICLNDKLNLELRKCCGRQEVF
jgi:hypothetical protein